jgi:lipopolysaccharide exporter
MKSICTLINKLRLRFVGKSRTASNSITSEKTRSSLMSDVYKIVSGIGLAQLLIALATPVLSRLYSQSSFGISTVFISLTLIISTVACLRYEFAILLPKEESNAVHLLRISLLSIVLVSLVTCAGILIAKNTIIDLLHDPSIAPYLIMVPLAVVGIGIYQAFSSWNTRTKSYWRLSMAKIVSAVVTIALQIGLGFWLHDNPGGLIIGFLAGYLVGGILMGIFIWITFPVVRAAWDWAALFANLKHYRKFPLIETWGTLLNAVSWQIPPLLLAFFFSPIVVGDYSMAYRLIQLPVSFVGVAIAQVYSQQASKVKEDALELTQVTHNVLHRLIGLGIFPALLLTVLGKDLFIVLLGPNWSTAGVYVQILGIWMFFWFASWPLGVLANVKGKQATNLLLQVILLVSRVASLVIGGMLANDLLAIGLFAFTGVLFYLAYALICLGMIQYPLHTTIPFLVQQIIIASVPVVILFLVGKVFIFSPIGMVLLGGLLSVFYFLIVMRKFVV